MNGSIGLLEQAGIKPFFYVCTDKDFARQQPQLFATALRQSPRLALWAEQGEAHVMPAGTQCYPLTKAAEPSLGEWLGGSASPYARARSLWSKRARSIGFSKDLSHGFFDARTVAYVALQLAYHLGFNEVLLVGVDLDQSVGRFYEKGEQGRSPCGLDQHWASRILPSLSLMKRQVIGDGFRVYNLSATSRIPSELIPKIDNEQALAIAGQRRAPRHAGRTSAHCSVGGSSAPCNVARAASMRAIIR